MEQEDQRGGDQVLDRAGLDGCQGRRTSRRTTNLMKREIVHSRAKEKPRQRGEEGK